MNREAILEICGVKEVFEVPQALMKKLFSNEQPDLLVYNAFYDKEEEREAETLSGAWSKLVQSVKKYFAF